MHLQKGRVIMTETENLCVTAMEECDELSAELSKGLRFGFSSCNPVNNPNKKDTATQAILEFYHVEAMIELLIENGVLPKISKEDAEKIKTAKKRKVEKYKKRSIRKGTLTTNEEYDLSKTVPKPLSHLEWLRYENSRIYFKTGFIDRLNRMFSKTDKRFELSMHVESEKDIDIILFSLDIIDTLTDDVKTERCIGHLCIESDLITDISLEITDDYYDEKEVQKLVDEYLYSPIVTFQGDYVLMYWQAIGNYGKNKQKRRI